MTSDNKLLSVSPSPHIKHPDNTKSIMLDVLIAMLPALIWSVYVFGWRSLSIVVICVASCIAFEYFYQKLMKKRITAGDLSAAVTGVLLAYNLPVSVPFWVPVIGAFFAIVVVKQLFGGIGKNIMNPALAARVFLFCAWPSILGNDAYFAPFTKMSPLAVSVKGLDTVAGATPLASFKTGGISDYSIFDMFIGRIPGCIGEVSAMLLILGGIYLMVRRVITWHIPLSYIGTVALVSFLFPKVESVHAFEFMAMEVFSGALMLGAIYMATDYATSPVSPKGRIIYGIGCGAITVFIRYFGGYSEGTSFAILIMNLLVWYIDMFTRPKVFGKVKAKKVKEKE
ncbi:MAG: RnfABCDGE type electron transport complex subunit D [Ruminococcaceae bacterium]|nr:RnfABCDGE type electron transport complex subunit D [Oscillospiraceae bacterium]